MSRDVQLEQYYGFYTNRPFWAVSKPDLTNLEILQQFTSMMSEVVAEYEDTYYKLRFCRDGLILFHSKFPNIDFKHVLEYINTLSILIESETQNWTLKKMFTIREVNHGDVFPYTMDNIEIKGVNTSRVNFGVLHDYNARFLPFYIPLDYKKVDLQGTFWPNLIKHTVISDPRIKSREGRVLTKDLFDNINATFSRVVKNYNSVTLLAQMTKSVEQFENGRYDVALILSWFIIETYLYKLYQAKVVKSIGQKEDDMSAVELLKALNQRRVLSYDLVGDIHKVRILRNEIVHNTFESETTAQDTLLSFEIIKEFIKQDIGLSLNLKF
jgi:hypothetical protein